ncbi:MAG: flagellar filament capping protein FliD [Moorellales bacterium]
MPTMTISGLASGLDTEEIIKQLLELERTPVTRLEKRKSELTVVKNAWKDLGTRLQSLLSTLTALKLESTFKARTVTSSNSNAVTATASATASAGIYRVWVGQLAQAHKVATPQPRVYGTPQSLISWDGFDDPVRTDSYSSLNQLTFLGTEDKALQISGSSLSGSIETDPIGFDAPQGGRFTLTATHTRTLNVRFRYEYQYYRTDTGAWSGWVPFAGSPFTYSTGGGSDTVTVSAEIPYPVSQVRVRAVLERTDTQVIPLLLGWSLQGEAAGPVADASTALGLSGRFSITVGSEAVEVQVESHYSLNDIKNAINAATVQGKTLVTASVIDNRLVITSNTVGAAGRMRFEDLEGSVLQTLGLIDPGGNLAEGAEIQAAQDAVLWLDGLRVTRSGNVINDVLPGVTLNLLAVTDTNGNSQRDPAEEVALEVKTNQQAAVEAVRGFVEQYNSVMDFIASKLGKTATGEPGDLFGDPTLARIQQSLRELVFRKVDITGTPYTSAGTVGLSTGAYYTGSLGFDRSGKLTLDEAKLARALEEDPNGVYQLFASSGGLARRLEDYLKQLTRLGAGTNPAVGEGVIGTKQKMLDLTLKDIDNQIARWEDRLARREEQLRRQFTAMEAMLGNLQSQANWLAGQITSLQNLSSQSRNR